MDTELELRCLSTLKEYWGYDSFRGIQADIIGSVIDGRDTLGLMPTGGGKSICFQIPALILDGLCLVVTPLISLMKDQVLQLRERGVMAAAVYSGMMRDDIVSTLDNAVLGAYKLLYISPERLSSDLFKAKLMRMSNVSMIVVDEAHCISQWGYDFRPSYLEVAKVRHMLPYRVPMLALTATATPKVVDDIQERLEFESKNVFAMSFERKNLIYVVRSTDNKAEEILRILHGVPQGSAIIYVRTRELTVEIARFLKDNGIAAYNYHAGLTTAEKDFRQSEWRKDKVRVMVATNAFGMGIDKSDVRVVIHYSAPDSIEAYFQEAGRAGRDGKTSYAVMLYNPDDLFLLRRRIQEHFPEQDYVRQTYENVSCFLQVGEGEGFERTFFFPMETFCRVFKQFPVQTNSALALLDNAGYLEYHEERDFKSALHFIVDKDELYCLHDPDPDLDVVIQTVLRNYTGVFAGFAYIEETLLAQQSGLTAAKVYETLKHLHHRRIIDFIPHRNTPTVTYTIPRVDTSRVNLPQSVYDERKADLENRIKNIITYISTNNTCRSLMMLRYFGDNTAGECGQCDVCVAKRKRNLIDKQSVADVRHQVMEFLKDGKRHLLANLSKQLTGDKDAIDEAMRQLLDEEYVKVQGAMIYNNNTSRDDENSKQD